jgi:nucleoid-associated protein EbfC
VGSKGKSRFKQPRLQSAPGGGRMQQLEQLQVQMNQAQAALAEATVTATAGGGAITIEMNGAQEVKSIKIKPEVVDPADVEMLQDLIMAAYQEALVKSRQLAAEKLGPLTGGIDIPGLF